jgi:hypothetical protein
MNYFHKESRFIPNQISCFVFIYNQFSKLDDKKAKYASYFESNPPDDIQFDDDLLNYDNSEEDDNKPKSYLCFGDDKGFLKIVNLEPIFKKYNIKIKEKSVLQ